MANQPLAFAELAGGGILLLAGFTGSSLGDILRGNFSLSSPAPLTGGASSGSTAITSGVPTGTGGTGGSNAPGNASSVMNQIGQQHGWSSQQIQDWKNVIGAEDASYSLTAKNPNSNAYGIAQFINGPSEYYTYGGNPNTLQGQLTAMANYIQQRYHDNPSEAWTFHLSNGYY